jgi:hypothetical protein
LDVAKQNDNEPITAGQMRKALKDARDANAYRAAMMHDQDKLEALRCDAKADVFQELAEALGLPLD